MCVNLKTFNESFREWARQQEAETFEDAEQSSDDTQQPAAEKKPERTDRENRGSSDVWDEVVFP